MYSVPEKIDQHKFEQEMTKREYIEDQDAEDPDDFIISLTTQVSALKSFISLTTQDIYIQTLCRTKLWYMYFFYS